jgi:hypothetical protein
MWFGQNMPMPMGVVMMAVGIVMRRLGFCLTATSF